MIERLKFKIKGEGMDGMESKGEGPRKERSWLGQHPETGYVSCLRAVRRQRNVGRRVSRRGGLVASADAAVLGRSEGKEARGDKVVVERRYREIR
jgi:hypothetical protein